MRSRFKPYRRFRYELMSLAAVLVAPAALFAVFPVEALRPLSHEPAKSSPSCAFVTLSPAEERAAIAAARASWQLDRGASRRKRVDLFADSLPAMQPRDVLDISTRRRVDRCALEPYVPNVLPATLAAPPPVTIAPQPDAGKVIPAFPKEEMLGVGW